MNCRGTTELASCHSQRPFKNLAETRNWDTSTLENKTMALKVSPRLQRDWGFQLWKRSKICILIFLSPPSEPFQVANSTTLKSRETQLIPEAGQLLQECQALHSQVCKIPGELDSLFSKEDLYCEALGSPNIKTPSE